MAHSSLLGAEPTLSRGPGHDDQALGPSDSSDSGSDVAWLDGPEAADPQQALDRTLGGEVAQPPAVVDHLTRTGQGSDPSPQPGRPNPEPDPPEGPLAPDSDLPAPDDDLHHRQPGRAPVLRR